MQPRENLVVLFMHDQIEGKSDRTIKFKGLALVGVLLHIGC